MVAGAAATVSGNEQADVASGDEFDESAAEKPDTGDERASTGDDISAEDAQSAVVTFENQTTAGEAVVVQNVTMASGGFVTIHDSSLLEGNVVGSVVGVSEFLERGSQENVEVTLDEPITDDRTLIAMPHRDTNNDHQYDFVETDGQLDIPYFTPDGQPVTDAATVTVSEEAPDTIEDAPAEIEEELEADVVEIVIEQLTIIASIEDTRDIPAEPAAIEGEPEAEPTEVEREPEEAEEEPEETEEKPEEVEVEIEEPEEEPAVPDEERGEIEPPEPPTGPDGPDEEADDEDNVTEDSDDREVEVDDGETEDEVTEPSAANISFDDQTTDGEMVDVELATVPDGGFVAVYDSGLLEGNIGTSFLGVSESLEDGTAETVEVELDESLADDETLIAVAHRDTNENEQFDLLETEGEEDSPYLTPDDAPVADDAVVTVETDDENGEVAANDSDNSSSVIGVIG